MVLRIGHRGACLYEPENTLRSFKKALDLHVDMIEFDVHCCASGEAVVIHDETLDRTTNGSGLVVKTSLAELKKLNAGNGETIPTLTETIQFVNTRAVLNIELKGSGTAVPVVSALEKYVQHNKWHYNDFLISSFSLEELRVVRTLSASVPIGLLFTRLEPDLFSIARELSAYSLHPEKTCLSENTVQRSHREGYKVFVWCVDTEQEMLPYVAMGVDGIFSGMPDKIPT